MTPRLRGRTSRTQRSSANIAKMLMQTAVFWSFFLFIVPAALAWIERRIGARVTSLDATVMRVAGAALFALGGMLGLTSGVVMAAAGRGTPVPFDCPNRLVVRGPYRCVRNPMVIAGLSQGIGVGMYLGSWMVIAYALCGGPVWNLFVRPWEERDLSDRFGDEYRAYCRQVRCWLPRRRRVDRDS